MKCSRLTVKTGTLLVVLVCMAGRSLGQRGFDRADELEFRLERPFFKILLHASDGEGSFSLPLQKICIGQLLCPPPGLLPAKVQEKTFALLPSIPHTVEIRREGKDSSPVRLLGLGFEITLPPDVGGEADFSSQEDGGGMFVAACGGPWCNVRTLARTPLSVKILPAPAASVAIRYVDEERKEHAAKFQDVESIDISTEGGGPVDFSMRRLGVNGLDEAEIEPSGPPSFKPANADTFAWKGNLIDTHGQIVRRIRLRASNPKGLAIGVKAQPGSDFPTLVANSSGIALIAINDIQMLPGDLGYEIKGSYRFAKQDIRDQQPREITISVYEKSQGTDLAGLSFSTKPSDVKVDFRDLSLVRPLSDFFKEHWDYFETLDKKFRTTATTASIAHSVAEERAQRLIAEYILQYLLDNNLIKKPTYERLIRGHTSIFFHDDPKQPGSDEALFAHYLSDIEPKIFLKYLDHTTFPVESASIGSGGSAASEDKLLLEVSREFRHWLPERINQGEPTLQIASLNAGDKIQITALLRFPPNVSANQPIPEIVASWASAGHAGQATIQLPIGVYDRYLWLKSPLFWFLAVGGAGLVTAAARWVFEMFAARWLRRRPFAAELVEAGYEVALGGDKGPASRVNISGLIRIHNRKALTTTAYCERCNLIVDKKSEELAPVQFSTVGTTQVARQIALEPNSTTQAVVSSSREYSDSFPESLKLSQKACIVLILKETSGESAKVKAKIHRRKDADTISGHPPSEAQAPA